MNAGIVVMYGFVTNQKLDRWTAIFLITTGLTGITGLRCGTLLPSPHLEKSLSLWACAVLYFNVFVLVVQSFTSLAVLHNCGSEIDGRLPTSALNRRKRNASKPPEQTNVPGDGSNGSLISSYRPGAFPQCSRTGKTASPASMAPIRIEAIRKDL